MRFELYLQNAPILGAKTNGVKVVNKIMILIFVILEVGTLYIIAPVLNVSVEGFAVLIVA